MGGAFASLGADALSLSLNPAGIAMYRQSEASITPGLKIGATNTDYFSSNASINTARNSTTGNLSGLAVVFGGFPTGDQNSFAVGIGMNRLANVLGAWMRAMSDGPRLLDFGEILPDGSLSTNEFLPTIPKSDYFVCRGLGQGEAGSLWAATTARENVLTPERFRAIKPGDRVLIAWVGDDAVVVDIILPAGEVLP